MFSSTFPKALEPRHPQSGPVRTAPCCCRGVLSAANFKKGVKLCRLNKGTQQWDKFGEYKMCVIYFYIKIVTQRSDKTQSKYNSGLESSAKMKAIICFNAKWKTGEKVTAKEINRFPTVSVPERQTYGSRDVLSQVRMPLSGKVFGKAVSSYDRRLIVF